MKRYNKKKNIRWNTMKILATGFLFVIVTGAVSLLAPVSNQKPIESLMRYLHRHLQCV